MRIVLPFAAVLCALQVSAQALLPPEIEDPQCLGINKEPAHATLMPYATKKEALAARRAESTYCQSLNGMWKFNWVREPGLRPVDFYRTDFDASDWKEITVPSNWQVQGYGTPIYRNLGYTIERNWPHVLTTPPTNYTAFVERDPVGSYRREFEVPKSWGNRQTFIAFDGVDSAFFLWINGQRVGYSVNSRNRAEFNITQYLKPGKNLVAVEVYTYSAGSYLEDQDMWRLSGIFRNVSLWSAPQTHIRDFFVKTDLDSSYRDATESITAKIHNFSSKTVTNAILEAELFDANGKLVTQSQVRVPVLEANGEKTVQVSLQVANPAKWSAEIPNLYTTVLTLTGEQREIISTRTGFRKIEIKNRVYTINGVPVKLKGANRHEHWPETGHYVPEDKMIRDLEVLKQGNCNHVRTCHYSDDPRWYELCDEWGIYLNAEANCECHGYGGVLDREPQYEKAIVDRSVVNVENFKNHASVVMWSLGNECGGGSNFVSALKAVKAIDLSRPVHYEGLGIGEKNPADVDSRMYTGPAEVARIATNDVAYTKPFYMCEYAHAMFNSMGELGGYNDIFDEFPSLMGGAIWEWQDQGLWNRRDPSRPYLAFGGGFGDFPNDHYFIHKGLVFSDRSPKPHYPEMKRVYQWVGFSTNTPTGEKITLRNKYAFINLGRFEASWTLSEDGKLIQKGEFPGLNVEPGKTIELDIPFKRFSPKPGADYDLRLSLTLKNKTKWAKAGYEVAAQQFRLPIGIAAPCANPGQMALLDLEDGGNNIVIKGNQFEVVFDKEKGVISQLTRDGKDVLVPGCGPKIHLWRAPHQKDDMWAEKNWRSYGLSELKEKVLKVAATRVSSSAIRVESSISAEGKNGFSVDYTAAYHVYGDGSIVIDNVVQPHGRRITLARMGVRMQLASDMDQFTYFGRGPMENYSDRKRGSDIGLYKSSVQQQLTSYAKPMECGNHEDVRWAALAGKKLPTLMIQGEGAPLQVSALPYLDEVMAPVEYSVDLPVSTSTVVTIASRTLGVGSSGCGPRPTEPNQVWSDPTAFSYVLRLLPSGGARLSEESRVGAPQDRVKPSITAISVKPRIQGHIVEASSFEDGEGNPQNALDGDVNTFWHTRWSSNEARPPHFLVVDYNRPVHVSAIRYCARADGENGHVKDYEVYLSNNAKKWDAPVAKGSFDKDLDAETIRLVHPVSARFMKFVVLSEQRRRAYATVAELEITEEN